MSTISRLLNQTAKVYRLDTSTFDRYGNLEKSWALIEASIPIRIDEHVSTENDVENRDTVTRRATLFSTYGSLLAYDELEIDNIRWRVSGSPQKRSGFAKFHHIEVQIEMVKL